MNPQSVSHMGPLKNTPHFPIARAGAVLSMPLSLKASSPCQGVPKGGRKGPSPVQYGSVRALLGEKRMPYFLAPFDPLPRCRPHCSAYSPGAGP